MDIDKIILSCVRKGKGTQIAKNNLEKEESSERNHSLSNLQGYHKAMGIKLCSIGRWGGNDQ